MVVADPNSPYAAPGHALVVCAEASLPELHGELENLGYRVTVAAEPYQAIVELLQRPLAYDAVVLSLPAVYREELQLIRTLRERLPHLDVLIAHTDGRHGALAEAMRLGATGLLGEEGLHRLVTPTEMPAPPADAPAVPADNLSHESEPSPPASVSARDDDVAPDGNEPILTAEELRALLHEQPSLPPT